MRNSIRWVAVFAVAATAVGCGDKGEGKSNAPTGGSPTTPAAPPTPKASPPPAPSGSKGAVGVWAADAAPIIAMMKPLLEMGVKMAESMGGADANPEEAKKRLAEAKQKLADLDKMKMVIELKADGTGTLDASMPGVDSETDSGTLVWSQAGDQVTITPKTSNGKPVEGAKAETKAFTLKGDEMSVNDGGLLLVFKRK